jgi:hypothetical protein
MIGLLLVIQITNAGNERSVATGFRPVDRRFLRSKTPEFVVCVVFDNKVSNRSTFRPALRACFDVNVCHFTSLWWYLTKITASQDGVQL